jgi:flagellar biosynthesis protein FlhG
MSRIITVTSGKGGVGKTTITTNLSLHLAAMGFNPCILDADLGLANINILLGINPEHTLKDVINNDFKLSDIIIKNYNGIDIIPGSSGIEDMANIDQGSLDKLIESFYPINAYDFLFIDTAAGISSDIISFCLASNEIIIVITPEPTSLTDAYSLLKVLSNNGFDGYVLIIVNNCKNSTVAKKTYSGFKNVVIKYLSLNIQPLGVILEDSNIPRSVREQKPFICNFPDTIASKCLKIIAKNLINNTSSDLETRYIQYFWKRFTENFKSGLNIESQYKEKPETLYEPKTTDTASIHPEQKEPKILKTKIVEPKEEPIVKPNVEHEVIQDNEEPEDKDINQLLKELITGVSSISTEIKNLLYSLNENINAGQIHSDTYSNEPETGDNPNSTILDFEKFLLKQKTKIN